MRIQLVRLFIILSVVLTYAAYLAIRLIPAHENLALLLTFLLFVLMLGSQFAYRSHPNIYEKPWFKTLAWIGSLIMGVWGTFVLLSLPVDFIHFLGFVAGHYSYSSLAAQILSRILLGLSGTLALLGYFEVLRGPSIRETRIRFRDLHPSLEGLTIAHISDLHVGLTIRKNYVEKVVSLVIAADVGRNVRQAFHLLRSRRSI